MMKDRFKFRAWDKKAKKIINWDNDLEWHALRTFDVNKSNLEFMQCTGLKDNNDKLIFEGDIVEIDSDTLAKILWSDDLVRFIIVYENIQADFDNYFSYELEIIGNIYEDPELLEGGE